MTIEEQLKTYILSHYKSIREFCMQSNIPYSTVDSMFKRGILGSSISVVIKICDKLNIEIDELINNKIVEKKTDINTKSNIQGNKEKSSDSVLSDSEERVHKICLILENGLTQMGFIQEGQELTDRDINFLLGVARLYIAFYSK